MPGDDSDFFQGKTKICCKITFHALIKRVRKRKHGKIKSRMNHPGLKHRESKGALVANIIVIGTQWGDEGKGKLSICWRNTPTGRPVPGRQQRRTHHGRRRRAVYQPSGSLRHFAGEKVCLIGNGVVVDPAVLIEEMDYLTTKGIVCGPEQSEGQRSRPGHHALPSRDRQGARKEKR